jgi:hypothetical protein
MNPTIQWQPNQKPVYKSIPSGGLSALEDFQLNSTNRQLLDSLGRSSAGTDVWRNRKLAEAHDLFALCELASRLKVEILDLREDLRALVAISVPTPCMPDLDGELHIAPQIRLGIVYPEEALRFPTPGYGFVEILDPLHVWHANVSNEGAQVLCLGTQLPAGIQLKEIILMTFGAISMQTVMIDELDVAGVLNPDAARWWQQNIHRLPLSKEAFLDKPEAGFQI